METVEPNGSRVALLAESAIAFQQAGDDAKAGQFYREAISIEPTNLDLRIRYSKLLLAHGHDSEAVNILRYAIEASPHNPDARLLIAQALTGANRGNEARTHLEEASKNSKTAATAYGMLGYWHQARGSFKDSKACFEESISLEPRQSLAYYGWAQSNRVTVSNTDLLSCAASLSEDMTMSAEDRMVLQYVVGKTNADLGQFEASMRGFDKANEAAFQINLGGKAFDRHRHTELVDGIMGTFSSDQLRKHRGVGLNSSTPIFIVGMMRSGTTLVEQILSSHTSVAAAGELEFWLDKGPSAYDLKKRSLVTRHIGQLAIRYEALLRSVSGGKPMVTDKMPQNFQMLGLIHLAFPKAPIVHIRRNPLDTCISIYTTAYQESPAFAHDRDSIVFAYKQYRRLMAHWRKVLPASQFLEIDYEELVTDPEPIIRKLLAFCKLPWSEECLSPDRNERLVTTPSLWQVRQPINTTAIERWRVYEPWLGPFRQLLDL